MFTKAMCNFSQVGISLFSIIPILVQTNYYFFKKKCQQQQSQPYLKWNKNNLGLEMEEIHRITTTEVRELIHWGIIMYWEVYLWYDRELKRFKI